MANTEIRRILMLVREAQSKITEAITTLPLTRTQRRRLNNLADRLQDLDNILVLEDLNQSIVLLETKSKGLAEVNEKFIGEITKLKKVSEAVDKVAKAVDALAKAASILGQAGLL